MSESARAILARIQVLRRVTRLSHAAVLTVAAIAVIQLATLQQLDSWLYASVILFAASIPAAASTCLVLERKLPLLTWVDTFWLYECVAGLSILAGIGGMAAMFFHFSRAAGVTFIVATGVALVSWHWAIKRCEVAEERLDAALHPSGNADAA